MGLDPTALPGSDDDAASRFDNWRQVDPFPDVAPALLNSADLFDYIATTGMIYPFEINPNELDATLKPASCGIRLGGKCVYWEYDDIGSKTRILEKKTIEPGVGDVLELPANSIVYATLAPTFRLPDYIAARFNLSIRFIYRGLLVGTGPLVDPGFQGKLSIPLHNLTAYSCPIPTSDVVLWMEFTKLSLIDKWKHGSPQPRAGGYVEFPDRKLKLTDVDKYVERARSGQPIISSIPELYGTATGAAELAADEATKAADEATRTRSASQKFQLGAVAALVVGLIAAAVTLASFLGDIQQNVTSDTDAALQRSNETEAKANRLQFEVARLRAEQRRIEGGGQQRP